MTTGLIPVEVQAPAVDPDHASCTICMGRTPWRAYRPHTLDRDCWCTRNADGERKLENCSIARAFL